MGSTRVQIEQKVSELAPKTTLHKKVVHSLVELYMSKCNDKGLDRVALRDQVMSSFNILDDFILDRIFNTMDVSSNSQHLKLDDFVCGMASLLTESLELKIKFCFNVYDLNREGYITREKMLQFLKNCIVAKSHDADQDDADEGVRELTEICMKKLDCDTDGRVSFEDFKRAVDADKLRLEFLGQCLPDDQSRCQCLKMLGDPDMNAQPVTITSVREEKKRHGRGRGRGHGHGHGRSRSAKSPCHEKKRQKSPEQRHVKH